MESTSASKKRSSDEDDFEILRQYILACPLLPGKPEENPAVKAALAGIDSELKRRERDAKLQKKFSGVPSTKASSTTAATKPTSFIEDEWQSIDASDRKHPSTNTTPSEEEEVEIINVDDDTGVFGKKLAEAAIAAMANRSQAIAKTPVAAIALALHSAMMSDDVLGFATMNSTDDGTKASNSGFAAPIRELPKTQFLPKEWDKNAKSINSSTQKVVLRYRKNGTGSVLLKVEALEQTDSAEEQQICVQLLPANNKEPPSQTLTFPINRHINLDSMNAALKSPDGRMGVHPALHYKALPDLMNSFATSFDLGSIADDKKASDQPPNSGPKFLSPPVHATYKDSCGFQGHSNNNNNPDLGRPIYTGDRNIPTVSTAFPPLRPQFVGDFSGDLVPTGGLHGMPNMGPGNMMGPNHPAFRGGGMSGVDNSSGFGMMPRFDPFGPPGGPQEINNGRGGRPVPPHIQGNPNNDILRPPNTFNSDMYS
ncbi:expressed unknown protein [Seminavis robusta]|uniref:PI31 proteasome regulator N-terminal domain-containing protein n=1 Tax=Seminavis robusta TaxID=568900 RepID=A0A9N8HPK7_9STRA|nr:expressed unknown protein [Seminavis robusta]|eukprot:Sro1100_g241240.1 n/a (482) ;mRNA; f:7614-9059